MIASVLTEWKFHYFSTIVMFEMRSLYLIFLKVHVFYEELQCFIIFFFGQSQCFILVMVNFSVKLVYRPAKNGSYAKKIVKRI